MDANDVVNGRDRILNDVLFQKGKKGLTTKLYSFLLFYAVIYMGNAVYGTFLPVYLHNAKFSQEQIGMLLSLGPLVAMFGQPVWGALGDRAKTKNSVLCFLLIGSGVSILFFPLSQHFIYLLVLICVFMFFQTSIFAISDAITLEELDRHPSWSFGWIRLGGTVGFAAMSLVFGIAAKSYIGSMFPVYAGTMAAALLLLWRFPPAVSRHANVTGKRFRELFRNGKLMFYLGINFVVQITLGYYYAFFPIYFKEMGGDSMLLGWSMVISSLSELPFLLYSGKIFKRVSISVLLIVAALASSVRWFLFSVIGDPLWILPVQVLHGIIFIVLSVTLATFINREVPSEWKASGQTLNGLLSLGAARIIGSFLGGIMSSAYGMRQVFLYSSWVSMSCVIVFGLVILIRRKDRKISAH
ncbi:MFS transporter, PPP family, 3-phenylpropionic acid transporter [Paenibacillus sp. yr247]|uniref:MFS transporter n=1 Tax=Paenibacillus sp. yr247 TaxID=1761880 RepID=UPI00088EC1E1|nr:MFS transporter [Paenibacillus sp. yr247]SDM81085.1 MFS transporter, PPP family, 3-phenylpropionic acid transporter [Paenibacillus sp. yr247]